MRELSLFTGAGGGVLGSKILGHTIVGYVEYENYCQKIIKQRIADGILDPAPIFGDIRRFISEGWADRYRGKVDLVTGGFPCQPFSVAGKGLAENDPRNMWPQTIEVIRRVRPRLAFLENVPGLLSHDYIRRVFGDLAESGYDCRWDIIGASDVGANHGRKRLWILAYSNQIRRDLREPAREGIRWGKSSCNETNSGIKEVANTDTAGMARQVSGECSGPFMGQDRQRQTWGRALSYALFDHVKKYGFTGQSGGDFEPPLRRTDDGMANVVDRLKCIGNGQVPICMAYAYAKLSQGFVE